MGRAVSIQPLMPNRHHPASRPNVLCGERNYAKSGKFGDPDFFSRGARHDAVIIARNSEVPLQAAEDYELPGMSFGNRGTT